MNSAPNSEGQILILEEKMQRKSIKINFVKSKEEVNKNDSYCTTFGTQNTKCVSMVFGHDMLQ